MMCCYGAYTGYMDFLTEVPSYQARATLQVNDKNSSPSAFLEDFEAFSMVGEFLLEMELIRSTYLIRKALKKIPIKIGYWKMEPNGWVQQYKPLPFKVAYKIQDSSWLDTPFFLELHKDGSWDLQGTKANGEALILHMAKGKAAQFKDLNLSLHSPTWETGRYKVIIRSQTRLMEIFADMDNLLVRLQDEHVALINIYYWHAVPAIATDYVNALAQTYLENFLVRKKEMAQRALGTLKDQIAKEELKLQMTEENLFAYRDKIKIWDVSSFRKLHLDILTESETRKLNTQLKIKDLENLATILKNLEDDNERQINYGSVRDKGYLHALEQIAKLQRKLKTSRLGLTAEHPKIKKIQEEISQIIVDLSSRVRRTLKTYQGLESKLENKSEKSGDQILRLPEVEQNLRYLERRVAFRQRALDSLNIKMIDAYVSSMSNFSFHRILEHELAPEEPIKPLSHVKIGVTSLMYTLYAVFFLLFLQGIKGVLTDAEDVSEHLELPIRAEALLNPFPQEPISQGMINLATDLILDQEVRIITLFDFKAHPDKFHSSYQLAYVLAELDQKTLLLNAAEDSIIPKEPYPTHANLDILQVGKREQDFPAKVLQHKNWDRTLDHLSKQYAYIVYVMQGIKETQDSLTLMKTSDLNLYAAGLYRSKIVHLKKVQEYLQENEVPHSELLLLSNSGSSLFEKVTAQISGIFHTYKNSL